MEIMRFDGGVSEMAQYYLVLLDDVGDVSDEAIPVNNWEQMAENERTDFLLSHVEVIGMICTNVYYAATEQDAIQQALDNPNTWTGGGTT